MVTGALGAVFAIFRAGAGLDGEQSTHLHFIRVKVGAVDGLGLKQQIVERQGKQGLNLGEGPVMTKGVTARGESIHTWLPVVISGILRPPSWDGRPQNPPPGPRAQGDAQCQVAEIVG